MSNIIIVNLTKGLLVHRSFSVDGNLCNVLLKSLFHCLIFTGLTFGQQYQAKNTDKINVFVQPNDSTLAYYGSGDVNKYSKLG